MTTKSCPAFSHSDNMELGQIHFFLKRTKSNLNDTKQKKNKSIQKPFSRRREKAKTAEERQEEPRPPLISSFVSWASDARSDG